VATTAVDEYVSDVEALAKVVKDLQAGFAEAERLARMIRYEGNRDDERVWNVFGASAIGGGVEAGAKDMLGWFASNDEDHNGSCFDIDFVVRDLDEFVTVARFAAERMQVTAAAKVADHAS